MKYQSFETKETRSGPASIFRRAGLADRVRKDQRASVGLFEIYQIALRTRGAIHTAEAYDEKLSDSALLRLAEREGFEPSIQVLARITVNGLAILFVLLVLPGWAAE